MNFNCSFLCVLLPLLLLFFVPGLKYIQYSDYLSWNHPWWLSPRVIFIDKDSQKHKKYTIFWTNIIENQSQCVMCDGFSEMKNNKKQQKVSQEKMTNFTLICPDLEFCVRFDLICVCGQLSVCFLTNKCFVSTNLCIWVVFVIGTCTKGEEIVSIDKGKF